MALTYVQQHDLINAAQFLGRIETAVVRYAVYLRNTSATGRKGDWARDTLENDAYRAATIASLKFYVVQNVAAGGALTGSGATLDSDATDAAIQSEVEAQINARYP